MIKLKHIKTIAAVIVGYGTEEIVRAIIKNNTNPEKFKDKFAIGVGTTALTVIAMNASKDYTNAKIDAWYEAWIGLNHVKTEIKEALQESQTTQD